MDSIRVVDIVDEATFGLVPPCADPGFDHRSCDYWEDADRGTRAARLAWLEPSQARAADAAAARPRPANPFLADLEATKATAPNPFTAARPRNPFVTPGEEEDGVPENPFAPAPARRPAVAADAPRKLQLLGRGLGVAGSYAKVLLRDDRPAAYAQFGPLTAYPRAQRTRDLYPALPDAPLPAVITCIATTAEARRLGLARRLVEVVCADLAERGFTAAEAYPTVGAAADATSAATPAFWEIRRVRTRDRRCPIPGHAPRARVTARRDVRRFVALLLPIALAAGGCGPTPTTTGTPIAPGTASPLVAASSPAAGSSGTGLTVDSSLLQALPAQIDGVTLEPDPATAAQIAADPTLAGSAQAIAVALAISPGTSSTGDDLAIVSVIRLRPGVFSDAWYANWRATYDDGACEVAGGVHGEPSETTIGGRVAYVGTCAGDARTYHVHLADPTLIVSITAAGARRFGDLVVAGLAE